MTSLAPCHHPTLDTIRGAADHYGCTVPAAERAYGRVLDAGLVRQVRVPYGLGTILYRWEIDNDAISPAPAPDACALRYAGAEDSGQLLLDLR